MKKINLTEIINTDRKQSAVKANMKWCENNPKVEDAYRRACEKLSELKEKNEKAIKKLNVAIDEAQHRSRERNITWANILSEVFDIEKTLDIPRKALNGCKFICNCHAQLFPSTYKYSASATFFELEVINSKWYLTDIYRDVCDRNGKDRRDTILTPQAADAIVARFGRVAK